MKAMLSQPLRVPDAEIIETRQRAISTLQGMGYDIVGALRTDEWINNATSLKPDVIPPLYFLAKSLEDMSKCQVVYFCKGWQFDRVCLIEHQAAQAFGREILYEEKECSEARPRTIEKLLSFYQQMEYSYIIPLRIESNSIEIIFCVFLFIPLLVISSFLFINFCITLNGFLSFVAGLLSILMIVATLFSVIETKKTICELITLLKISKSPKFHSKCNIRHG